MGAIERFWICPQYENLRRMREDPARFFPGEAPPLYCSNCEGPQHRKRKQPQCIIWAFSDKIRTPRQRRRLARKINRALRRRKCQLNAERRQREAYERRKDAEEKAAYFGWLDPAGAFCSRFEDYRRFTR